MSKAFGRNKIARHKFQVFSLMRGLYSRVAKRLGVDRSFVSRVASGSRKSKRVEAELLKEMRDVERQIAKQIKSGSKAAIVNRR